MKKLFFNRKKVLEISLLLVAFIIGLVYFSITAKAETTGTISDNNVNVRKSADAGSDSLGKVNSGDKVTVIEEVNGADGTKSWYKVTTSSGITGYIRNDFVTTSGADTTNTTTTTTTTTANNVTAIENKTAYISKDVVNIRSEADTNKDNVVYKANLNTEITVTGETTGSDGMKWYQISLSSNGKTGFVRSDMLTFTKPTNNPVETTIDSNKPAETTPDNTDTQPADTSEPEPVEQTEPTENVETEEPVQNLAPAKSVTAVAPAKEPDIIPSGFVEKSVESEDGVRVWQKGDFAIIYGVNQDSVAGWYVYDSKNETYIAYDGLFDVADTDSKDSGEIFGIPVKWVIVALIVVIILLLGAVFFLALKLSRGVENDDDYEYYDYEDEEEEEDIPVSSIEEEPVRNVKETKRQKEQPKEKSKKSAKDKFLDYFTTEVEEDEEEEEYYDDQDDDEDDDDIDFIDI